MENSQIIALFLANFIIISLASKEIGRFFKKVKLPLISGFLFTGIISGPFVLGLISLEAAEALIFIEEIALAFIAFAAGSELHWQELQHRWRSIAWVTGGLVMFTFGLGSMAVFLLGDAIPFMRNMPPVGRTAVAILAGAILVARSPSAAIAVINELRAKGPFTQLVLGVTVIMDVVVITLFAVTSSVADALLTNIGFSFGFLALLLVELLTAVLAGYLLAKILQFILARNIGLAKIGLILLAGFSVFLLSDELRHYSHENWPFEFLVEPLLVCMIGSFITANYSGYRSEFLKVLRDSGLPIYIAFFTITGASLRLDILVTTWTIALLLFFVRLIAIFSGSFSGGILAGEPMRHNRIRWMAFITQAGVGLGLAQTVSVRFAEWGQAFATLIISVIVFNEIIGPLFFKWSINLAREAHTRADTHEFDGIRDAVIFGLETQSLALARQLSSHGWHVKIATRNAHYLRDTASDVNICPIPNLSLDSLCQLDLGKAEAVVTLLSDEENYQICELVYENFGTDTLVVRLHDRAKFSQFHALGALIVDPDTAIVSLLDHFVRSPAATSLLLGMEQDQDVVDIEVRNLDLHNRALRDLQLPLDILILSVRRHGRTLISHGYTRLKMGDWVTIVGSLESLETVMLRFEEQN